MKARRQLGRYLRRRRKAQGLSLRGLAATARVDISMLVRIEAGTTEPRLFDVARLARALGETLPQVLQQIEPQKEPIHAGR